MIKIENVVLPSADMVRFAIEGMRNPMNSWGKSDTTYDEGNVTIGDNDLKLMKKLSNNGPVHSKYLRMLQVGVRITAPLYWYKEFDTYKVGTVANSCSTMHKIHSKEFTLDDFSVEHLAELDIGSEFECKHRFGDVLEDVIRELNLARKKYLETKNKRYWWQMIQLLPSSYNQTRNVTLTYEVLKNIYRWRYDHKVDDWRTVCKWIETLPYAEELIVEPVKREIRKDKIYKNLPKIVDLLSELIDCDTDVDDIHKIEKIKELIENGETKDVLGES